MPYACPIKQRAAHNEANARWRKRSAKRYAAQQAVKAALASGRLIKWPGCAACPRKRGLEAHHYDYDQPLCVTWLCMKCHKAAHAIVGSATPTGHAMHKNSIKYRDTYAAPGSALHEAVTSGDATKAKAIYEQCESDARELLKPRCKAVDATTTETAL